MSADRSGTRDWRLELDSGSGFQFGFGLAKSMYQLDIFDFVRQTRFVVVIGLALTLVFLSWEILVQTANLAVKCHFVQTS